VLFYLTVFSLNIIGFLFSTTLDTNLKLLISALFSKKGKITYQWTNNINIGTFMRKEPKLVENRHKGDGVL